jgi:DHA1 family multidrug resistance protein-like MFS transporter
MSLYLFGMAWAPIWTPHVTERTGRSMVYLCSLPTCGIFLLGAGLSHNFAGVAICRFLAGAAGGPCLVLIEGTFADIWSAETTNTYYAFFGTAAYISAACGPIAGGRSTSAA